MILGFSCCQTEGWECYGKLYQLGIHHGNDGIGWIYLMSEALKEGTRWLCCMTMEHTKSTANRILVSQMGMDGISGRNSSLGG